MKGNRAAKKKYLIHKYTVVLFNDEDSSEKLFECIPDLWFVNELRKSCFFPPKTGKAFIQRAINCEKPEDNWNIYECIVVSSGYTTYSEGFKVVKEKCSQRYNTSSAEEELQAANFRRQHPGLTGANFDNLFSKHQRNTNANANVLSNSSNAEAHSEKSKETSNDPVVFDQNSCNEIDATPRPDVARFTAQKINPSEEKQTKSPEPSGALVELSKSRSPSFGTIRSNRSNSIRRQSIHSRSARFSEQRSNSSRSIQSNSNRSRSNVSCQRSSHSRSSRSHSVEPSRSRSRQPIAKHSQPRITHRSRSNASRSSGSIKSTSDRSRSMHSNSNRSRLSVSRQRSSHSRSSRSHSVEPSRSRSRQPIAKHSQPRITHRSRSNASRSSGSIKSTSDRSRSMHSNSNRSRLSVSRQRSSHSRSSRLHSRQPTTKGKRSRGNYVSRKERQNSADFHPRLRNQSGLNPRITSDFISGRSSEGSKGHKSQKIVRQPNSSKRIDNTSVSRGKSTGDRIRSLVHQSIVSSHRHHSRVRSPPSPNFSITSLVTTVKGLTKTVERNNDKLFQIDRRLSRLEVTINKIFVTVGDMNGNIPISDDDSGIDFPDLPINSKTELAIVHGKLKDKEFRKLWLKKEKDYCCPEKNSTDNVAVTKYLKRFIALNVRCQVTLMEPGDSGLTLHRNYHQVYLFLIDLIRAGYRSRQKVITEAEAHTALRVVWGRSKQLKSNAANKK